MKPGIKHYRAAFTAIQTDPPASTEAVAPSRLGAGSWIILIVLLSLLALAGFVVYLGWTLGDGIAVSTAGYVAMAAGVIFSLGVGWGLMALIYYSNRSGYDEPPVLVSPEKTPKTPGSSTGRLTS
jgi:hypothetical protein